MTLRAFHYVFITLSVILAFGFAYLEFAAYSEGQSLSDGIVAVVSALVGVVLLGYGVWFYRKSRKIA